MRLWSEDPVELLYGYFTACRLVNSFEHVSVGARTNALDDLIVLPDLGKLVHWAQTKRKHVNNS